MKKEKRARRKITEQLELEQKRRLQAEEALKQTAPEQLRMLNGQYTPVNILAPCFEILGLTLHILRLVSSC